MYLVVLGVFGASLVSFCVLWAMGFIPRGDEPEDGEAAEEETLQPQAKFEAQLLAWAETAKWMW